MQKLPSRVHVIGICGVATSALAIAFHEKGVRVTGSDKGFFPPVSTELERHGIEFYAGWHPEKMIEKGLPEVIIVGTASGTQNPETAYAKERNIPLYSFAEAIGRYFAQENSIVCVGTWGKTSSTALLSHILNAAGMDPTYMFGGVSLSHGSSAHIGDSPWSVFEGDEYKSSPIDPTAKFFYYKPTHLLLSAISWDHADLYPTEKDYFDAFKKLLSSLPKRGGSYGQSEARIGASDQRPQPNAGHDSPLSVQSNFIVACADNEGVLKTVDSFTGRKVFYSKRGTAKADYTYEDVTQTQNGLELTIKRERMSWKVRSPLLGTYQAENITGCFAMASELGVPAEKIVEAIGSFKGLKRRLEKRLEENNIATILDDIAHSPEKASSVLSTLRAVYTGKIVAVFEPNIGGRRREAIAKYDDAFKNADFVVIPRLTKLKVGDDVNDAPMDGDELARVILKTQQNASYIDDDAKLVEFLAANAGKGDVIVFLGSHGFRGMIEETITCLRRLSQS